MLGNSTQNTNAWALSKKEYACIVRQTNGQVSYETQREITNKWHKNEITYAIFKGTLDTEKEKLSFNLAHTTWEAEIPLKLKLVKPTDNPDIKLYFLHAHEDELFKKEPSVLAYAYYPETGLQGTVVFNDEYLWTFDGKDVDAETYTKITGKPVENPLNTFRTFNLNHTMIHELGHTLGLVHDEDPKSQDVMDAYYNGKVNLSDNDIKRVQAKYGKRNWTEAQYLRFKHWLAYRKTRY